MCTNECLRYVQDQNWEHMIRYEEIRDLKMKYE